MLSLQKMFKKSESGFTLVELIVVIAILGILAVIAIPRVVGAIENARYTAAQANVRTLNGAVALYLAEDGNEISDLGSDVSTAYKKLSDNKLVTLSEDDLSVIKYDKGMFTLTIDDPNETEEEPEST